MTEESIATYALTESSLPSLGLFCRVWSGGKLFKAIKNAISGMYTAVSIVDPFRPRFLTQISLWSGCPSSRDDDLMIFLSSLPELGYIPSRGSPNSTGSKLALRVLLAWFQAIVSPTSAFTMTPIGDSFSMTTDTLCDGMRKIHKEHTSAADERGSGGLYIIAPVSQYSYL